MAASMGFRGGVKGENFHPPPPTFGRVSLRLTNGEPRSQVRLAKVGSRGHSPSVSVQTPKDHMGFSIVASPSPRFLGVACEWLYGNGRQSERSGPRQFVECLIRIS